MGSVLDLQNVKSRHLRLLIGSGGLKQQRGTDHLEIGILVFRCPTTQLNIESDIEIDRPTFLRIGQFDVRVRCRACRRLHEFKVANGSLAPFRLCQPCGGKIQIGSPSPTIASVSKRQKSK
jgi:hypothetical protein